MHLTPAVTLFLITFGAIEWWLHTWEGPPPLRNSAGTRGPEADALQIPGHPQLSEDQRSSAGTRGPEADVQQIPEHPHLSVEQDRQIYRHHKRNPSVHHDRKTRNINEPQPSTNTYLQLAKMVADNSPNPKDCYVCGLIPHSTTEGLPLMALPITPCDTCHVLNFNSSYKHCACPNPSQTRRLYCDQLYYNCYSCNTPTPLTLRMVPKTLKWCVEGKGNIYLGTSKCDSTYTSSEELLVKSKRNVLFRKYASPDSTDDYNYLAMMIHHCSVPLPKGVYWICGMKAYEYLPKGWSGVCNASHESFDCAT